MEFETGPVVGEAQPDEHEVIVATLVELTVEPAELAALVTELAPELVRELAGELAAELAELAELAGAELALELGLGMEMGTPTPAQVLWTVEATAARKQVSSVWAVMGSDRLESLTSLVRWRAGLLHAGRDGRDQGGLLAVALEVGDGSASVVGQGGREAGQGARRDVGNGLGRDDGEHRGNGSDRVLHFDGWRGRIGDNCLKRVMAVG